MRRAVSTLGLLLCSLLASSLSHAGDGYVGVYADSLGITPCATIPQYTSATLYVLAKTDGQTQQGITGAEFRHGIRR